MRLNQTQHASASDEEECFSIPVASVRMGVDSFTIYGLIQRDQLRARRARWGEFMIPQTELDRVLQPPAVQSNDGTNGEEPC